MTCSPITCSKTLDGIQECATSQLLTYNRDRSEIVVGGTTSKQKWALAA
ncbi:MAG: hypothetical protein ACXW4Z_13860 [Candidatus Binatia bacterium]